MSLEPVFETRDEIPLLGIASTNPGKTQPLLYVDNHLIAAK